jgi:hypothetical protein
MNKHWSKKPLWLSVLSAIILGVFILLAAGSSLFIPPANTVSVGKGYHQETYYTWRTKRVTTGKHDAEGRWMGTVKTVWTGSGGNVLYTEEAVMLYGMREGPCTVTYPDKRKETYIYHEDQKMPKFKTTPGSTADTSAFQILDNKYPWFLFSLYASGFDSVYVEAFMDTVETMLNTYEFDVAEFDNYYGDVLNGLEETPYDSILTLNSDLFLMKGLEELKNVELRLAVIDRYRSESGTTYGIISTTYPGYLHSFNDSAVTNQDFEAFCQDLDSCMDSYGVLDPADSLFIDSLDVRMGRALYTIINDEESTSSINKRPVKSTAQAYNKDDFRSMAGKVNTILKPLILKSSPPEVGNIAVSFMLLQFIQGDILRKVIRESWSVKKGIIRVPSAATVFEENNSSTSVTLHGYVFDDGGSVLRTSGIAWASFYNPTVDDNVATRETGTAEDFTVILRGLTEGATYYARTYATNTAGVAYGNCIRFIATAPSGIADIRAFTRDVFIYPNPASDVTTFSFQLESQENVVLTILNMKGQVVWYHDNGILPQSSNLIQADLSGLPDGTYTCLLTTGTTKVTRKFVIAH